MVSYGTLFLPTVPPLFPFEYFYLSRSLETTLMSDCEVQRSNKPFEPGDKLACLGTCFVARIRTGHRLQSGRAFANAMRRYRLLFEQQKYHDI